MDKISQYLLTVITAALLCGLVCTLLENNKTLSAVCKVISGIILLLTMLKPLLSVRITNSLHFYSNIVDDAKQIVDQAQSISNLKQAEHIKKGIEQYILNTAKELGAMITVEVELDEENMYIPCGIMIDGSVSPYVRTKLTQLITDKVGIPKEAQTWTG